jgi:pyruvate dehydrogenase E1 component alpha subunit
VIDAATRLALYRDMLRVRLVEEAVADRYHKDNEMRCPVHLSIGQEGVSSGVCLALRRSDQIVTTHRGHAHYLSKGGDLNAMLCEFHGKAPGCCGGRGGSMHLFDGPAGVLLSAPIVASSIPVGVGAALGMKQSGSDDVAVVFLGDASVEEGVFHESANFAAIRKLPVIFVCENNLFSVYTPLADRQPDRPLTALAEAHGIPAGTVDGNDAEAVYRATSDAADAARKGNGPAFILADTYRWREHCGPYYDNDLGYRTVEEFESWKARDPLAILRGRLMAEGLLDDAADRKMHEEIAAETDAAFTFALNAPFPEQDTAAEHVYA